MGRLVILPQFTLHLTANTLQGELSCFWWFQEFQSTLDISGHNLLYIHIRSERHASSLPLKHIPYGNVWSPI